MIDQDASKDPAARITPWILIALGLVTAGAGVARIWFGTTLDERLSATTLQYFAVAAALVLLRHVKSLAFGDYKLEFQELARQARQATQEAKSAARTAEDAVIHGTLPTQSGAMTGQPESLQEVVAGPDAQDPWKGALGSSVDDQRKRRLRATVTEIPQRGGWYSVELVVESTAPRSDPLHGQVRFLLHPTFANDRPVVPVAPDGRATLNIVAWGAFTAGAITQDGATLELDLARLESAPPEFRAR